MTVEGKKNVPGTIVYQFLVSAQGIAWLLPASFESVQVDLLSETG